jgi:xanthine dehydrogenase accessory factor
VYEIALTVAACLRAGTRVDVAWPVEVRGISSRERNEALALTPGGGRVGGVVSGALDDQLADIAERGGSDRGVAGRLVELHVGDLEAELAGLSCGGDARCLVVAAADLPAELWDRLSEREPVCLVTRLDGHRVVETVLYGPDTVADAGEETARLFGRGASATVVEAGEPGEAGRVITILWPVPKLVVVGEGAIATALSGVADLLGWRTEVLTRANHAAGVIAGLARLDKIVVISHDDDLAGAALAAALGGRVGYIGALGSRRTQQSRADWLAYRGITDLARVHGPAGLDIGANTPAEIAVAIVAEALAVHSGREAGSLRERSGAIH